MTTKAMAAHLRAFDIFHDDIDVKFQPAEGGAVGDVDLVLAVREKGRLFLKGGTEIGGGEGGAVSFVAKRSSRPMIASADDP